MAKEKSELVNCILCGRDTRARDSLCVRCRGCQRAWSGSKEEAIGRKTAGVNFSDSPLEEADDHTRPRSASSKYHGDTFRDDV